MRTDDDIVAELDTALEDAADIDLDIAAAGEFAAQVEARRIGEAHARLHQRIGPAALQRALELGELGRAVDARDLFLGRADGSPPPALPRRPRPATTSVR